MSIQVTQLTKLYGNRKAVDNLTFTIKKGEVVGFLGPNGAGKSTTMKILTGCLPPTGGHITINGLDIHSQKKAAQQTIGYLPEHNPLYPAMYVREFLAFQAQIYKIPKHAISKSIDLVGLASEAHKKIGNLSKGYRQRVGLAAALLHDPQALILDEPSTGLDPNQLEAMRDNIRKLGEEKIILLSTHLMQEVQAVCNRALLLHKGRLVADVALNHNQQNEEQVIEVEFDNAVQETLLSQLPQLIKTYKKSEFIYQLTFNGKPDNRSAVFDFASQNKLRILQLTHKNKDLETLFREHTAD